MSVTNDTYERNGVRCCLCARRIWPGASVVIAFRWLMPWRERPWPSYWSMGHRWWSDYRVCLPCASVGEHRFYEGLHDMQIEKK
jgi:hypothetical protein